MYKTSPFFISFLKYYSCMKFQIMLAGSGNNNSKICQRRNVLDQRKQTSFSQGCLEIELPTFSFLFLVECLYLFFYFLLSSTMVLHRFSYLYCLCLGKYSGGDLVGGTLYLDQHYSGLIFFLFLTFY